MVEAFILVSVIFIFGIVFGALLIAVIGGGRRSGQDRDGGG